MTNALVCELGSLFCKLILTYLIRALILTALYLASWFQWSFLLQGIHAFRWTFCLGYSDSSYSSVFSYSASWHESKIYFLFIKSFLLPWGIVLFTFSLFFCPFFLVLFDNSFKGSNILFNAVVNHHWIYYYGVNYSSFMNHWKNCNHTNSVKSME